MNSIQHWIHITNSSASGVAPASATPEDVYRQFQYSYPKFFKMDPLCKWAWLGAEALLQTADGYMYDGIDKTRIGLVIATSSGCLDVDKAYAASIADIASPALFVYTLPNIMLGEISIRHGLKGEQLCLVDDTFNTEELDFVVNDMLNNRGMDACICGWANVNDGNYDVCLFWVTKENGDTPFTAQSIAQLYNT